MDPNRPDSFADLSPDEARRVDAVCRAFEASWSPDCRPAIEDQLPPEPGPLRDAMAYELIALELELRRGAGEDPLAAEYLARFADQFAAIDRAFAGAGPDPETLVHESATIPPPPTITEAATIPPRPPVEGTATVNLTSPHEAATMAPPPTVAEAATMAPPSTVDLSRPREQAMPDKVRYFGDYELLGEIARGGMGVVYRARQVSLNRPVALKMILAGQLADETDVRRFRVEAEAAAGLEHPGIVPIFEAGEHEGQHYFSMGFIEGSSLSQKVADGPLPPREAATLTREVAEAIQYAHDRGVIHRDLKPQNVLLDRNGRPKVTDFGLAKKVESDEGLTASGAVMGTPSYMPPEQAAGDTKAMGPAADVYSLGAVLYCLLTGRPPFQSSSAMTTLLQVMESEPVAPRNLNPAVNLDLETICLKCLQKEIHRRYLTARDLADDLGRWLRGEPIVARPVSRPERAWRWCRRNPIVASLLAALFVVLAGVAVGSSWTAVRFRDQAATEKSLRGKAETATALAREKQAAADSANTIAQQQRAIAEAKSTESQQRLVNQLVSNANLPRTEEDWLAALPWYAEALAIDADHPDRGPLHRMRVGATLRQIPRMVHLARMPLGEKESVSLAPNGLRLVGLGDGGMIAIDPVTGHREETRLGLPQPAGDVRLSPDGRVAVRVVPGPAAELKKARFEILAWDVAGNRPIGPAIEVPGASVGLQLAFSPDGRRLATWAPLSPLRAWDLAAGREIGAGIAAELERHLVELQHAAVAKSKADRETAGGDLSRLPLTAAGLGLTGRGADPAASNQLAVIRVVFSDDGRQVAASVGNYNPPLLLYEYDVRIFDAETGRPLTPPLVHPNIIPHLAFSRDGSRLLTLTSGGTRLSAAAFWQDIVPSEARVWDSGSGRLLLGPLNHGTAPTGHVAVAAFSPDGTRVATAGSSDVRIWEIATGRSPAAPAPIRGTAVAVAFSPDGQRLAAISGRDGEARAWDAGNLRPLTPPLRQAGPASMIRFSPDGRLLVTVGSPAGSRDLESRGWDLTAPAAGSDRYLPGQWSTPDGRILVHADMRTVRVQRRNVKEYSLQLTRLSDGGPAVPAIPLDPKFHILLNAALSADGHRLIAVLVDRWTAKVTPVRTWNFRADPPVAAELKQSQAVTFVALDSDGQRAVTVAGADRRYPTTVTLWDLSSNQGRPLPLDAGRVVVCVAFSPDGRRLLTVQDGQARLWDPATATAIGEPVTSPRSPSRAAMQVGWVIAGRQMPPCGAFTPDGRLALVTVGDAAVHRLVAESGESLSGGPIATRDAAGVVAVSGDGRRCIAPLANGTTQVWDIRTGRPVGPPLMPLEVNAPGSISRQIVGANPVAALSSDGRLAVTMAAGSVHVWEVETGLPIGPPLPESGGIQRVLFGDGANIIGFIGSGAVRTWGLAPDPAPAADLARLAGLLSGRDIGDDGAVAAVPLEELGPRLVRPPRPSSRGPRTARGG